MTGYAELLYRVEDRVATITLNRPDRMNAWTPTMEVEMRAAVAAAVADDSVRAIVLTGAGRGFCAGADLGRMADAAKGAPTIAVNTAPLPPSTEPEQRYAYLLSVPKPLIAGINGAVAGVGFCITLYCDLRYMASGAKLATSFARRGLVAEQGSAWLLPRLIGPMNAADLLLSGRTIDAAEAASMGLVRELPADGFGAAVQARAAELASLSSPRSMRLIKQQLGRASTETLADANRFAYAETALCRVTDDFKEGVASYVERRAPNFTGH